MGDGTGSRSSATHRFYRQIRHIELIRCRSNEIAGRRGYKHQKSEWGFRVRLNDRDGVAKRAVCYRTGRPPDIQVSSLLTFVSTCAQGDPQGAAPIGGRSSRDRSREDRLAFAVHAYLLADGYKLVAVGKDADEAPAGACPSSSPPPPNHWECSSWFIQAHLHSRCGQVAMVLRDECTARVAVHVIIRMTTSRWLRCGADADLTDDVPLDGWNTLDGTYAFRYVDSTGKRPPLLVKALSVSIAFHPLNLANSARVLAVGRGGLGVRATELQ